MATPQVRKKQAGRCHPGAGPPSRPARLCAPRPPLLMPGRLEQRLAKASWAGVCGAETTISSGFFLPCCCDRSLPGPGKRRLQTRAGLWTPAVTSCTRWLVTTGVCSEEREPLGVLTGDTAGQAGARDGGGAPRETSGPRRGPCGLARLACVPWWDGRCPGGNGPQKRPWYPAGPGRLGWDIHGQLAPPTRALNLGSLSLCGVLGPSPQLKLQAGQVLIQLVLPRALRGRLCPHWPLPTPPVTGSQEWPLGVPNSSGHMGAGGRLASKGAVGRKCRAGPGSTPASLFSASSRTEKKSSSSSSLSPENSIHGPGYWEGAAAEAGESRLHGVPGPLANPE
ncbi:hypothetical protein H920_14798 [Fukomys damarensis]|uniref:Uncharacterized protein n=1 Tax=Fukomys damarensis TaxID=885580 RepID=A0A091CVE6_FUKDA|nr:hypothetical protein H920_14798 [Fukomys damarensis]